MNFVQLAHISSKTSRTNHKKFVVEVKNQNFKDLVEYVKQKEPGSKFVDADNVNAGTRPGPFQMNDLCIIDDHSINVIDIF